ncbi:prostaglandin reductase [Aureococcus anophagefferens]|nr:prostaglandin reductase [Aureococcus anophagefferens]
MWAHRFAALLSLVAAKPSALELRPVPTSYNALVAGATGSSFGEVAKVVNVETPELAADEVLVQVCYAGVNGGCETFRRARGDHMFAGNKEAADFALGAEGVGLVAAVGADVRDVAVGDSVCFVNAAFAEYSTSKASMLWRIPRGDARGKLLQIGYISEYPHNPEAAAETAAHGLDTSNLFWKKETIARGDQTIIGNAWPDFSAIVGCKDRVLSLFHDGELRSLVDERPFEGLDAVPAAIDHIHALGHDGREGRREDLE